MKRIVRFLSVLLPLLALVSCSSLDVMKRRYNNGFYVHHSGKRSAVSAGDNIKTPEYLSDVAAAAGQKNTGSNNQAVVAGDKAAARTVAAEKSNGTAVKKGKQAPAEDHPAAVAENNKTLAGKTGSIALYEEKEMKKQLNYSAGGAVDEDAMFIILLILSLIVPPLAVYLKQKSITVWFWVTLILCLLSGVGLVGIGLLYSGWFIAFVIALLVVLDVIQ